MNEPSPRSQFLREAASAKTAPPTRARIPLVKPFLVGNELDYIRQTIESGNTAGDGMFTERACQILRHRLGLNEILLVSSGTSALELAAMLFDLAPGDEAIMPAYTFVATANAFARLGVRPVFVDIRPDTLNLDETKVAAAITPRTRAIVPVHYAGIGCEMDALASLASERGLALIEDAAQGLDADYRGRPLGAWGDVSAFSFHEAKNVTAGQAGAVCVNRLELVERAEILRDKGTNRRKFFRGEASHYEWVSLGAAHALSEINAAFLCAQLEKLDDIAARRRQQFETYRQRLAPLEAAGQVRIVQAPAHCRSNHHIFYLILADRSRRDALIQFAHARGVGIQFHYVPLHTSSMGRQFGYSPGDLPVTEDLAGRLARLPLYHDLRDDQQQRVCEVVLEFFGG